MDRQGQASTQDLILRLRQGDDSAAAELVRRYEQILRLFVRKHLPQVMRPKVDSADILQNVWISFFPRMTDGTFNVDSDDALRRLLIGMAVHKLQKALAYASAKCRSLAREDCVPAEEYDPADSGPSPDEVVMWCDYLKEFRRRLSPEEGQVLDLYLTGHTWPEIAVKLGGTADGLRMKLDRAITRVLKDWDQQN